MSRARPSGVAPAPGVQSLERARVTLPWLLACLGVTCGAACGAAAPSPRTPSDVSNSACAERARALAPDLYARAEALREDAERSEAEARADLLAASDLQLQAACDEAERIGLQRERHAYEARLETAEIERTEIDRQRHQLEAELQRKHAAQAARAEAARMFELAARDERPRDAEQEAKRNEVAAWMLARAELTLAAALALGLTERDANGVTAEIERVRAEVAAPRATATARIDAARKALHAAERALGQARASADAPSPAEVDSVLESAAERGLAPVRELRGVVIELTAAFAPGSAKLTQQGRAALAAVAALLRAHPHGPAHIEAASRARLGRERAAALFAALRRQLSEEESARLQRTERELPEGERVFVTLVNYASVVDRP